ncbi:MAG: tetrathionate reductase family octaheme c-type cytochrome [Calditrichae bacterium]|nr:tetrathionate reductase family octaheme c-type cytochrome [Calditrichota bacterium]MCB9058296.1 tetrathionate reductase family octaheme c-type cytochrome [Calditrichia bacterium]
MRSIILFVLSVGFLWASDDDHSKMTGPYSTPQEITAACLECHQDAAKQVMGTTHWTWESLEPMKVQGHDEAVYLGKKNLFNNFCVNLYSNWPRCTSCHAGYGWKDASFDFKDEKNVDCLVCHDQTGTYNKTPTGAGMPDPKVDLVAVAQSVGPANRETCGSCHFYGGGGENVKHGDLEPALINPTTGLDVHMGGNDMVCQDCHEFDKHQLKGIAVSVTAVAGDRQVECAGCHEETPHEKDILNTHFKKVACQTCHIPVYAKELPTKMYWDWSTAGQDLEVQKDKFGKPTYDKKKGDFIWDQNIQPEYLWYNGNTSRYLAGDKINENGITQLNYPLGSKDDADARIYPFKVHRGKQISDAENKYLIVPKLMGGYWKHFDWNKAAEDGMKSIGLTYSGKFEFVETEMFWRVNHEVSAPDMALKCTDCHQGGSRLDWKKLGYDVDPAPKEEIDKYMKQ